jgi:hypothetical protein
MSKEEKINLKLQRETRRYFVIELKDVDLRMWTGFSWLRIRPS